MNDFRFTPLDDKEFHSAVLMWRAGKNTPQIANALHRHESVVANCVSVIKTVSVYASAEVAE